MTVLKPSVSKLDHFQGNSEDPITLVEYGDYQCTSCGRAYLIIKKIQKQMGENLKFVFRNFPLENIHPKAIPAAIAAEAAAKQDKFWEMHDIIFENQVNLHENSFKNFAEQLGLEMAQFNKDIENEDVLQKIESDFEGGVKSGVNGTPAFFINGIHYNGSWEYTNLLEVLQLELKKEKVV